MAVLIFNNYRILKATYKRNLKFIESGKSIDFNPSFNIDFEKKENNATIEIMVSVKDQLPFDIDVKVEGNFTYDPEQDTSKMGFDTLLKKNATAILYPYVRAIVTQLTSMSNEYPPLTLPTVNIGSMIDDLDDKKKK